MIDLSTILPPMKPPDPYSDIGRLCAARGYTPDLTRRRVLGTRRLALDVLERLPADPVTLDCSRIDVMSPPFIHELRTARDDLTFEGMNEDVAESWELVDERLRDA